MDLKAVRAVSLISGGLDGLLATRLVMDMGIDVLALNFVTPFFGMGPGLGYDEYAGEFKARMLDLYGIKAEVIDISEKYIEIVGNPPHGYGKDFNPCLDCKIMMVSEAKRYIDDTAEGGEARLIVTGEVLGQRPMSQRRDTLRIIERESDCRGILLRPLSARLLEPTVLEEEGYVDRGSLLGLSGRGRKPQIALAGSLGIEQFEAPAGGCCLTDPIISKRIRRLYGVKGTPAPEYISMMRAGRPFHLGGGVILTLGRDDGENRIIEKMGGSGSIFVRLVDVPGPLGLMRGDYNNDHISLAISILARYSKARNEGSVRGGVGGAVDKIEGEIRARPIDDEDIETLRF
ncbi:MAG: thiamine biosynthesis protein [Deltaproteobacteria bacterium]|uniref:Thiamine biosynthesis protein n=1 Tax=Candidatus Zymogenus saltonus TaxID=2844893 RepID=A0A9D8PML2_9DELT|nr:thiamine biosynthesis protein [Candidatus Zymogenus saltonus]